MDKFFLELLSKILGLDEAGVTALFNADWSPKDDTIQKLLELDKTRVATIQKGKLDEGYKKAQKEIMSKFETEVKTKFGIDSDAVGLGLVEAIIESKAPRGDGITEEQVKKSKTYLDLSESIDTKIKDAVKAEKQIHETYKSEVERGKSISVVKQKALTVFESLKPILSTDPAKAAKQKELFLQQFEQGNYRLEGERIIMLNADGTDRTDEHAKRVDFESVVKETAASVYDFQVTDPKNSPAGGGAGGAGGGGGAAKPVVKDEADYMAQFYAAKTPADKIAVTTAWEELKTASK